MAKRTFEPNRPMYRGNLHTHTTVSDGTKTPDEAVRWYREQGYDFVAVTDHWRRSATQDGDGIVVIPGVEFDGNDPQLGMFHVVGLNVAAPESKAGLASLAEVTSFVASAGGLAVLCHPYWCGMPSSAVLQAQGVFAVEVYNSTCEVLIAKGLSSVHWDDALAGGRRLWGLAVDDTHWRWPDYGGGWVMVQAEAAAAPAILGALAAGRFYATTGPAILDFWVEDGQAHARTSEAERLCFVCDASNGRCFRPAAGEGPLSGGEYKLPADVTYVRLEVDDGQGKRAWSNPIFLKD